MPGHGLGAAHLELLAGGVFAEYQLDRFRFVAVASRSRCGMGVHVADFFERDAGILESRSHTALSASAFRSNSSHVIGIRTHAVADDFAENFGSRRWRASY